jgi:hypothetical protein
MVQHSSLRRVLSDSNARVTTSASIGRAASDFSTGAKKRDRNVTPFHWGAQFHDAGMHGRASLHRANPHDGTTKEQQGQSYRREMKLELGVFIRTTALSAAERDRQRLVRVMLGSGEWSRSKPCTRLRRTPRSGLPKSAWSMFPVSLLSRHLPSNPRHPPSRRNGIAFWCSLTGFARAPRVIGNGG